MPTLGRRKTWAFVLAAVVLFSLYTFQRLNANDLRLLTNSGNTGAGIAPKIKSKWAKMKPKYRVKDMRALPTGQPLALPKVQNDFSPESDSDRDVRLKRRDAVLASFQRCWKSYRKLAWMSDELTPVSGGRHNPFGGWGATLVDSLDTLWIMGLKEEFEHAVAAASKINFNKVPKHDINVFETNIRYLGGFLAATTSADDKRLLTKAKGSRRAALPGWGQVQVAHDHVLLAEIGSFSLEFIRLSILTGDPKWYDAVQRIIELLQAQQQTTRLPGMWPVVGDARKGDFTKYHDYTLGAMADSLYEYLPKTYALAGGLLPMYREMYEQSMDTAIQHNLFRPMLPDEKDVLVSGLVRSRADKDKFARELRPEGQHLVCFAGGMFALGGKLINNQTHVEKGEKLTDGCIWAYQAMPLGIMPEWFDMLPCESAERCPWDEDKWRRAVLTKAGLDGDMDPKHGDEIIAHKRIPKGFVSIGDSRYLLRPEAIESVFILYRVTGRKNLLESAWNMFEAIEENTKTPLANSALDDITVTDGKPSQTDSMESFWLGETLKYFYLMFSEPDLISLDEYVFNTEAHPLKRLLP
ncbi:hypothetical protein CHGG_07464 [Chaetomium globosum CBS 148.51]|uniref:alpha-1,2-Mannosidase n=1 Tax=Chaetomium globosum (strain ATCC 6205 / CBS 148.51 / DSM 1962 / NBRC 6347 / NRRL 1970) TaxID=306901 RepID=Q2GX40_CHAGB|nr:uncharacterized protein CHGG_07464 [Chaetomium globosum CBS 148.51]EAQ86211.1 hypothetical protein CHGG_07464 [Chaetomium globosum CBS 148.51]